MPLLEEDNLRCLYKVGGNSYHTQGYGANTYARGDALDKAAHASAHGLITEVREIAKRRDSGSGPFPGIGDVCTYGVFANTTEAGWEMVTRRPPLPLREWVRQCWANHVNPRVYMPFLPHGYEESEGLDFLGGEVTPR